MIMERFGDNLERHFAAAGKKFSEDTVSYIGLKVVIPDIIGNAMPFIYSSTV